MEVTKDRLINDVIQLYFQTVSPSHLASLSHEDLAAEVLTDINTKLDMENQVRPKGRKLQLQQMLEPYQIAAVLRQRYVVVNIKVSADVKDGILGIYQETGLDCGIYSTDEELFSKLILLLNTTMSSKQVKDTLFILQHTVDTVLCCQERNLVPVGNGIFDYDTKQLLPFSPEYVFLSKSKVDYNPGAKNVVIHNSDDNTDWDVESWMDSLDDDPAVVQLLWQILGAVVRPLVPWGRAAWFCSSTGNNGKGTLCELMRQLVGQGSVASISLSDMNREFMLESISTVQAIIVDENDVGVYIDRSANLKAIVTGDVLQVNRKYKSPVFCRFRGFMVQCMNDLPRVKDKTDSFSRRQLIVMFTKCFTGRERKYIKQDYIKRKEVLEYVLQKVLNMNYYEFDIPVSCQQALEEYQEYNDPVRQFLNEILPVVKWDLLPFGFLHDLYVSWYRKNIGERGEAKGTMALTQDIINLLPAYPEWDCEDKRKQYKPVGKMDVAEPLIAEYDLEDWKNQRYATSKDVDKMCLPVLKAHYRGLIRKSAECEESV